MPEAERSRSPYSDCEALAPKFNAELDRFINLVDTPDYKFPDVPNDMDVLRAFITVNELGGSNTVRKFATHGGYTLGIAVFDNVKFIRAFADLDLERLTPDAQRAMASLINSFDHPHGFNITKGNIAHVLMVTDMVKGSKYEVLDIEKVAEQLTTPKGSMFAGRRLDLVVKVNPGAPNELLLNIELKNWSSATWENNLSGLMSRTPKATGEAAQEAAKEVGQPYTDQVRYMRNGNKGHQWMFTPDVIEGGLTKAAMEDKIIGKIEELIDKHASELASEFEIRNITKEPGKGQWAARRDVLFDALNGDGPDGQKFVAVYDYANIAS